MHLQRPAYMKVRLARGPEFSRVINDMKALGLNTVCEEARCPNLGECWGAGTATIMVLGAVCTRNCRFCSVKTGNPHGVLDPDEPLRVARAVADLGLKYAVITSVDRDDLPDGGAGHYAAVIRAIKGLSPDTLVEALIPDYTDERLDVLLAANPDCLGHNIETTRRMTPSVRDRRASYDKSLDVLRQSKVLRPDILTKSSVMVGLGESMGELEQAFEDLAAAGVDILTIGQYLRPTSRQLPVVRYYEEADFDELKELALSKGIKAVVSGPLVRSSYKAVEVYRQLRP